MLIKHLAFVVEFVLWQKGNDLRLLYQLIIHLVVSPRSGLLQERVVAASRFVLLHLIPVRIYHTLLLFLVVFTDIAIVNVIHCLTLSARINCDKLVSSHQLILPFTGVSLSHHLAFRLLLLI